ncbi:MAG: YraN family protein [Chitinivibrionales bacterium]|nr:YraN family protein [Chitinivibrionales bacterium]MBD3397194.1 YraN family protein [Chitinivibrionales bacterium]
MDTRSKGRGGEDRAVEHLLANGYRIVARNYECRDGEIDCVAEAGDGTLVFVEVKAARSDAGGDPFSWVTRPKQRTLARMARRYLADHDIVDRACRFDVIAIVGGRIEHMENAFLA